jgi:glycosyltransferase involved in cell wall biosynthesis
MNLPLVSVICLCYNHGRYIREAVDSVLAQTYPTIEIIIVDDFSTDDSRSVLNELKAAHPEIKFLLLDENLGNCKAFNIAFKTSKGQYVVDFATDDVMLPKRIEQQINRFEQLTRDFGVVFTDAIYIDEAGKNLYEHFAYLKAKRLIGDIPQGDVYQQVLKQYFICGPTMLVRREVFELLDGYDERLAYEDFDFWLRSSRIFKYSYLDEVLTKVRRLNTSMSSKLYGRGDQQLMSTYLICEKAISLNKTQPENEALLQRVRYEFRHSVLTANYREADLFFALIKKTGKPDLMDKFFSLLKSLRVPLSGLRKWYHFVRYS